MVKPHPAPQAHLQSSACLGTSTESQISLSLIRATASARISQVICQIYLILVRSCGRTERKGDPHP